MNKYGIYLLVLCALFTCGHQTFAQGENKHWHFGYGHHIDFNSAPATYNNNSSVSTFESSATVSDAQGNLLFYTIGCRIWDRNGNEMPNATGLKGNGCNAGVAGSGQESVQVIPHPAHPDLYFVFSACAMEDGQDTVYYHLVNMRLNGGLGDVVPGSKNTVLYSGGGLSEFTTTAYGDCRNFWYIVTMGPQHNYAFYAYKVDEHGISTTPVISTPTTGLIPYDDLLAGSTKILSTNGYAYRTTAIGLLRSQFSRTTGQFNNFIMVPNTPGSRFDLSPNEQLLYMANNANLKQYNLQAPLATIGTGATTLAYSIQNGDVRLAPDNKIYVVSTGGQYLARVEQPDLAGAACTLTPQYLTFPSPLPPMLVRLGARVLARAQTDTFITAAPYKRSILCEGDSIVLSNLHPQALAYSWSTGSQAQQITVGEAGTYWRYVYTNDCKIIVDTFKVLSEPPLQLLGNDTGICTGDHITLNAALAVQAAYLWNDGSTGASLNVSAAGMYYVTATVGNCSFSDTVVVDTIIPRFDLLQNDTLICTGSPTLLQAVTNMNSNIHWSNGHTGPSITITQAGIYTAYTENKCGTQSDTVRIEDFDCNCKPLMPNAFTPNGDGRNDIFMPVFNPDCDALYYELKIYNRYGQLVYMTNRKGTGWDGTYSDNRPADAGVYFYTINLTNRYGDTERKLLKGDIMLVR